MYNIFIKPWKIENVPFSIFLGQIPLTFLNDTPTECAILNVRRYKLTDRLRNNTHINDDFIMISPNIPPNIPPPKYIIPTTINSMKNTNTLNDNMKIVRDLLEKIKKNENDDENDDDGSGTADDFIVPHDDAHEFDGEVSDDSRENDF